eukprot:s60_g33.t1
MLDALDLGSIHAYKTKIEQMHLRYGENKIWSLLYQADTRARFEHWARTKLRLTHEHTEATAAGKTTPFDSDRPWNYSLMAIAGDDRFWSHEFVEPALIVLSHGKSTSSLTSDDAKVQAAKGDSQPFSQLRQKQESPGGDQSAAARRTSSRTGRVHDFVDGKYRSNRTGHPLCQGFQTGACKTTTNGSWCAADPTRAHQCARCLSSQHGEHECGHKESPQVNFLSGRNHRGRGGRGRGKGRDDSVKCYGKLLGWEVDEIDVEATPSYDLLDLDVWEPLLRRIHESYCDAALVSPPCCTFSAARASDGDESGPKVLRAASGEELFGFKHLDTLQRDEVKVANILADRAAECLEWFNAQEKPWILEQPARRDGHPSLLNLPKFQALANTEGISGTPEEIDLQTATLLIGWELLGVPIAYHKASVGSDLKWVGLQIAIHADSIEVRIPPDKMADIALLSCSILKKNVVPDRELRSYIGKVMNIASVIHAWKPFVMQLYAALHSPKTENTPVNCTWTTQVKSAITWILVFVGQQRPNQIIRRVWSIQEYLSDGSSVVIGWDASPWGFGAVLYINHVITDYFIDVPCETDLEILQVQAGSSQAQQAFECLCGLIALRHWSDKWQNKRSLPTTRSDNIGALVLFGQLSSHSDRNGLIAREAALDLGESTFRPQVVEHVPGVTNQTTDALSRMHQPGHTAQLPTVLVGVPRSYPRHRARSWWRSLTPPNLSA